MHNFSWKTIVIRGDIELGNLEMSNAKHIEGFLQSKEIEEGYAQLRL